MSHKYCFVCGFKKQKCDYSIAMHRFPKKAKVRSMWMDFCGLTEGVDKVDNVFVCSLHFDSSDFTNARFYDQGRTLLLKPGAVPSKKVPQPLSLEPIQQSSTSKADESGKEVDENPSTGILPSKSTAIEEQVTQGSILEEIVLESTSPSTYKIEEQIEVYVCPCTDEEVIDLPLRSPEASFTVTEEQTPKKRKFEEPRYVSEIRTPDLSTPRKAHRVLELVRRTDRVKSKKIKSLQDQNRKLKLKVKKLEQIIEDLLTK